MDYSRLHEFVKEDDRKDLLSDLICMLQPCDFNLTENLINARNKLENDQDLEEILDFVSYPISPNVYQYALYVRGLLIDYPNITKLLNKLFDFSLA